MIRLLENEETRNIKLYDTVSYAGYDWYVIGLNGVEATLLIKDNVFGEHEFDPDTNDYKTSYIRKYLDLRVLTKLRNNGANPLPARLSDVGVLDKVWLLSIEEAEKLPRNILEFNDRWWLRSQSTVSWIKFDAAFVNSGGKIIGIGSNVNLSESVRPAMRVKLADL